MRLYNVRDWMTPDPITIGPKTTLNTAYIIMKDYAIRRLPVIDDGVLVGIVTWGDLREASASDATSLSIWELNYLLSKLTVDDFMTRDVYTIHAENTIHDAAKLMMEHKLSGLPVVDDAGTVVGIITESDIFRMVVQQWEEAEALESEPVPAM